MCKWEHQSNGKFENILKLINNCHCRLCKGLMTQIQKLISSSENADEVSGFKSLKNQNHMQ